MYYLLPAILIGLLLPLLLNTFTTLDSKQKRFVYVFVFILIVLAGIYEYFKESTGDANRTKVLAFTQGNSLLCKERSVDHQQFNLVSGTMTFVAKPESRYKGESYQLQECEVTP